MLESLLLGASPQQLSVHLHAGQLMWSWAEQPVLRILWPPCVWLWTSSSLVTQTECSQAGRANYVPSKTTSPGWASSKVIALCVLQNYFTKWIRMLEVWGHQEFHFRSSLLIWDKILIQSQAECDVIVLVLIQAANCCFALFISDWLVCLFASSFPAESKGQNNPVFKDYLPGSSDLPEENKPVEPTSLWKQTSHTHSLPPGLEYLNQVLNLSKC